MSMQDLLDKIEQHAAARPEHPVPPPAEFVGLVVRWDRSLRNWKASTLAGFAGVSLSTIERVERGAKVSILPGSVATGSPAQDNQSACVVAIEAGACEAAIRATFRAASSRVADRLDARGIWEDRSQSARNKRLSSWSACIGAKSGWRRPTRCADAASAR
jgi:hypothetical protein